MAFESFRDFVAQLDRAGELIRVSQPVATELEITELANRQMKSPPAANSALMRRKKSRAKATSVAGHR
jgi:4-hydroxy-3-polyprenylbenzoate decarboxylase